MPNTEIIYPNPKNIRQRIRQGRVSEEGNETDDTLKNISYVLFAPKKYVTGSEIAGLATSLSSSKDVGTLLKNSIDLFKSIASGVEDAAKKDIRDIITKGNIQDFFNSGELTIALPFKPFAITDSHSWEDQEVMRKTVGDIAGAASNLLQGNLSGAVGKAGDAVKDFATDAIISNAQGLIAQSGIVLTFPKKKVFNGSTVQSFNFDYTFVPYDEIEAKEINKLISVFRFCGYAQRTSGTDSGSYIVRAQPALWRIKFPEKIQPQMTKGSSVNEYYCVLSNCSVTYGKGEFLSYYKIGNTNFIPNEIKLTLSFTEYVIPRDGDDATGTSQSDIETDIFGVLDA